MNDGPIPYDEIAVGIETSVSVDTIHDVNDEVFVDELLDTAGESSSEPPVADETMEAETVEVIDISEITESPLQIENITDPIREDVEEVRFVLKKRFSQIELKIREISKFCAMSILNFKNYFLIILNYILKCFKLKFNDSIKKKKTKGKFVKHIIIKTYTYLLNQPDEVSVHSDDSNNLEYNIDSNSPAPTRPAPAIPQGLSRGRVRRSAPNPPLRWKTAKKYTTLDKI